MRVTIITGGGSGIGAAVARRLAASDQCLMLHGQGTDAAGIEALVEDRLERRRPPLGSVRRSRNAARLARAV